MTYDLIIRNGTIVDGTGFPGYRADVGVHQGRIATIGRIAARGVEEIDASGQVVSPGFIDGHTHMDAQVMWDPMGTCSCWHGVTTVVMGNCGFTLAPVKADQRPLVVRNLERAEDISATAMAAGIEWQWESFPEYLDVVDRRPKGINYAAYIGHSALRTWAMGERAFDGPSTPDDIGRMSGALREALQAGAIGFTTSRSSAHQTTDNRPVASRLAAWEEVEHLVGVMGDAGAGIFEIAQDASDRWIKTRSRVVDMALKTRVPCTFGVLARPETYHDDLRLIDSVTEAGGQMFGQTFCRGATSLISFATRLPFDELPHWRELRARPLAEQAALLRDPDLRRRLIGATEEAQYREATGPEMRKPVYDQTWILDRPYPPYPTVAEVAAARNVHPIEAMIDIALEAELDRFFAQALGATDLDHILEAMRHPRTIMTFSDSGAHVSQINDFSLHSYFLGYWVRTRGAFTLPEAVRMITLAPARAWGFANRGLLREGLVADINVFDPDRIGPGMPHALRDLPGGAMRLVQKADGIRATVVAGTVVLREGEHTGRFPGRLLRGPLAARQ
ncbi:MAG: amidohydrolase family protein [Gammaproteobacteria bacterium]